MVNTDSENQSDASRRLAELFERLRSSQDPEEIKRLGDELGRMILTDPSD